MKNTNNNISMNNIKSTNTNDLIFLLFSPHDRTGIVSSVLNLHEKNSMFAYEAIFPIACYMYLYI